MDDISYFQESLFQLGPAPGAQVITPRPASYGTLAASGGGFTNTTSPFVVSLAPTAACGTMLNFKITATYGGGGSNSPQVFFTSVPIQPASITATAGSGQSATTGAAFSAQIQAIVRDQDGNPVPGVGVMFSAPTSGPGATFPDGNLAVTDSMGRASVVVRANSAVGLYAITANTSNPSLTTAATFVLTNTAAIYMPLVRR